MSDKAVSKSTRAYLEDKEASSASDAFFDDFSQGLRGMFKGGFALMERTHDVAATIAGSIQGEEAVSLHTKNLENEAISALKAGRIEAARHFFKRDFQYTSGTQGFDNPDTQRLLKEISLLNNAEKWHNNHMKNPLTDQSARQKFGEVVAAKMLAAK